MARSCVARGISAHSPQLRVYEFLRKELWNGKPHNQSKDDCIFSLSGLNLEKHGWEIHHACVPRPLCCSSQAKVHHPSGNQYFYSMRSCGLDGGIVIPEVSADQGISCQCRWNLWLKLALRFFFFLFLYTLVLAFVIIQQLLLTENIQLMAKVKSSRMNMMHPPC